MQSSSFSHPTHLFRSVSTSHPKPMKLNLLRLQGNKSGRLTREMRHKSVDSQRTHKLWSHGSGYPESPFVFHRSLDRHLWHMDPTAPELRGLPGGSGRK